MATQVQLRRGDNTAHGSFTGAVGEVTVNTTNDSIHVHDGSTSGGFELARASLSNITGDTDNIAEGSTNLYYTNARVDAQVNSYLSGGTGVTVSSGAISLDFTEFSTTNITEGTNLYFTDTRARAAFSAGSNISITDGVVAVTGTLGLSNLVEDTTPQLGGDLETNSNDIKFADNDKAIFGAGSDLQIYHDGSNSYVKDAGTGDLYLQGTQLRLLSATGESFLIGIADGGVYIYHNGNAKLVTQSTGIEVIGGITVTGTVDGRDVATDGTKLDGIESNATADQTGAEIKAAYEAEADTNAFDDAAVTKLAGIEASADVTDTANVTAAGALMDSEVTNLAQVKAFDSSDYATAAQGALADSALQSETNTTLALSSNTLTYTDENGTATNIDLSAYLDEDSRAIASGTLNSVSGVVTFTRDDATTFTLDLSDLLDDTNLVTSVAGKNGVVTLDADDISDSATTNKFTTAAEISKLAGIETGADVTDTTNVVAALTAGTNVTIGADGTISSTDTNTTYSVGDGGLTEKNFTTALNTKLSGIETGATADQTASEILTAIKTVDGAASGLDADLLDGQQGSHYLDYNNFTNTPTIPTNNNQLTNGAGYITADTQLSNEQVQDIVGAMVSSNTESGISVTYQDTDGTLDFNVNDPTISLTGAVTGSATMTNLGNVSIATTATADPTLTLAGDASGSTTFTNLGNATLTVTIADDSHNHTISNVDGLQTALDAKAALASPSLTGTPTAPTASTGTNTTQLATTAFVQQEIAALKALLYAYDPS